MVVEAIVNAVGIHGVVALGAVAVALAIAGAGIRFKFPGRIGAPLGIAIIGAGYYLYIESGLAGIMMGLMSSIFIGAIVGVLVQRLRS